jgi:HK97 family phage major capsid protein
MDRLPVQRYAGQVPLTLPVYAAALALGLPVTPDMLEPIGFRKDGSPIYPMGGGDGTAPVEITPEQLAAHPALQPLLQAAGEAAVRAVNTVNPDDRPGGAGGTATRGVPAFNRGNYELPRLGVAMRALSRGQWRQDAAFEKDIADAAQEIWGYRGEKDDEDDEKNPVIGELGKPKSYRSVIWPKSREEMVEVLIAVGEKAKAEDVAMRAGTAIRAMNEGTGSAGGFMVPTQYLQDQFAYALTSTIAVRAAGIEVMPVVSNVVALPRESAAAGASQANEAGTLSSADATLAQQTINVRKQYGLRRYSNELLNDATPRWNEFLARTLVRDVALQQDIQYIAGSGSAPQIQGLIGYSGITSGPSLGANGSSPTLDHFYDAQYNLRAVNAEPDFAIMHPRVLNSLGKLKDSAGNYLLSQRNGVNGATSFGTGLPGAAPKAVLLDTIPVWFSSQISIAQTVGSSSDCTTAIVGRRDQVLLLERSGIEVAYSEHIYFTTDESAVRAIGRSAIAILQPTAVETITGIRP